MHVTTETQQANELDHHRGAGETNRMREKRSTQMLLTATAEICMKTQVVLRYFLPGSAGPHSFITSCRRQDELISGCAGEPQAVKEHSSTKDQLKEVIDSMLTTLSHHLFIILWLTNVLELTYIA